MFFLIKTYYFVISLLIIVSFIYIGLHGRTEPLG